MKHTIIFMFFSLFAQSQDINNAIRMYQKGEITETEFVRAVKKNSQINYVELAEEYTKRLPSPSPLMEAEGSGVQSLAKAFKWLKETEIIGIIASALGIGSCGDIDELYRSVGKVVVDRQLNPYLIEKGEQPLIDQN